MTREEAINRLTNTLQEMRAFYFNSKHISEDDEKDLESMEMAIKSLEQEPFINKPCVSEQACHEDKVKVLDKIRAEIKNDWQLKKYPGSPFSCGLRRAIEIIDKYKAESENKNED